MDNLNIVDIIGKIGIDKAILQLVEKVKQQDSIIIELQAKIAEYEKMQIILGNSAPIVEALPSTEKKTRERKARTIDYTIIDKATFKKIIKKVVTFKKIIKKVVTFSSVSVLSYFYFDSAEQKIYFTNLHDFVTIKNIDILPTNLDSGYYNAGAFYNGDILEKYELPANSKGFMQEFSNIVIGENVCTMYDIGKYQIFFDNLFNHVSDDETRYFMNGVCIDTKHKKLVATDGRRLLSYNITEESTSYQTDAQRPIMKNPSFSEIYTYSQYMAVYENVVIFRNTNIEYTIKNIQGQFPMYERVLQYSDRNETYTLPSLEELRNYLKLSKLYKAGNKLRLNGGQYFIDDKLVGNGPIFEKELCLNVQYLIDCVEAGIVELYFNNAEYSIKDYYCKAFTHKGDNFEYLIMPMGE